MRRGVSRVRQSLGRWAGKYGLWVAVWALAFMPGAPASAQLRIFVKQGVARPVSES